MKINKNFLIILTIAFMYNSCDKSNEVFTDESSNSLEFNIDSYTSFKSNLTTDFTSSELVFSKKAKSFAPYDGLLTLKDSSSENETLNISASLIDLENLNEAFNIESSSVIASTLFKDNESDIISGICIYLVDNENDLKLYIYKRDGGNIFQKINMDAKKVSDFMYDHLFYISKEFFPGKDIESLVVNNVNEFTSEDYIDDFSILEVVSRFGFNNNYDNFNFLSDNTTFNKGKPCGAVPLCQNGGANSYCAPFAQGCRVQGGLLHVCGKLSTSVKFADFNMNNERAEFDSILPNELLYSLRDELELYVIGGFLTESYYTLTKQFEETLDVELLTEILLASPKLYNTVNAFVQNDSSYILTDETFNEFSKVINLTASKSQNKVYKGFMSNLVENLKIFRGKNISEIKTLLIPIEN